MKNILSTQQAWSKIWGETPTQKKKKKMNTHVSTCTAFPPLHSYYNDESTELSIWIGIRKMSDDNETLKGKP